MGEDVTDDDDDDDLVTETDVDLDPSLISEITITHGGDEPIAATADSASPADSEPRTLEPRLVVRGLAGAPTRVPTGGDTRKNEKSRDRLSTIAARSHKGSFTPCGWPPCG